jgi:16S rRNA (guanine527-N7)-methyltransferase
VIISGNRALFLELLSSHKEEFPYDSLELFADYYQCVLEESEVQNLTTQLTPEQFYEVHFLDCLEFVRSGLLNSDNVLFDLGSGLGVPGLGTAILSAEEKWVLSESEKGKADFLLRTVERLGLSERVKVVYGRAEQILDSFADPTVVIRAVGPISRIMNWISTCSTWNRLILFKGPGWQDEWNSDSSKKARAKLRSLRTHNYFVGADRKTRIIVELEKK